MMFNFPFRPIQTKSLSVSVFLIFFFIGFVYLAWNNFQLPVFFLGETAITKGKIINYGRGNNGEGFKPIITYAYRVDDSLYFHQKRKQVYLKEEKSEVGRSLKIKYEVEDPSKHSIEGYYKFDMPRIRASFLATTRSGLREIFLRNDIITVKESDSVGTIYNEYMGELFFWDDTLEVHKILTADEYPIPIISFLLKTDAYGNDYLLGLEDSLIYK